MKRLVIILIVLILFGLALPVSNLVVGLPANSITKAKPDNPLFAKALGALGTKCVNCHTPEYTLPFYAKFPVAKQIIETDIRQGTRFINYLEELFPQNGGPVTEPLLAKTEFVLMDKSMPPMRYLALHWNGGFTAAERDSVLAWIKDTRTKHYATSGVAEPFKNEAIQPLPDTPALDPAKVALGNKLFHDKRLSKDNSLACAGCHDLQKGGTDQKKFSEGVGQKFGDINAPTVFNAGFQFKQFWDGRAATLEEQADGPVNNPIEMASNWPEAIGKLQQDAELTQAFQAVYPQGYSKETITEAIATFERTLDTPSKLDKFLRGQADALSPEEKKGYDLFKAHRCATCHAGKILGGQSFEIMGLYKDYFKDRGNPQKPDFGRFNVTNKDTDKFKLKVPTLRNIALTFPYFHDSTISNLQEAVQTMAKYQAGKTLSEGDAASITAFLNALTGELNGQPLK
ncbi:MAG TPA: cytochrome c peroxidase [Candidatus Hydrogenedentes bacterium]|nr:cytochrome c peroxidase [Candidatus Hydrogenedentota bacterium]